MFLQQITSHASCAELRCRPALLCPPFSAIDRRSAFGTFRRSRPVRTMAAQLGYEAWVKGDPKTKTLGDCKQLDRVLVFVTLFRWDSVFLFRAGPFCHRALLTLEEKHAKYTQDYVDFAEKPEWCVPVRLAALVAIIAQRVPSRQRHQHCTQATRANSGCSRSILRVASQSCKIKKPRSGL